MASRKMFWHVPQACWHAGIVQGGTGNTNNGRDIIVGLVATSPATNLSVPDNVDDFVVKRIVGQYLIQGDEDVANDYVVHHRVYPTTSDATSVAVRDLDSADEAESDFLWHMIEPWSNVQDGRLWGNWNGGGVVKPEVPFRNGRLGDVDITVNRRIGDGQDLIWHTFFAGVALPDDNAFDLFLWIRILLQEAG